VSAGGAEVNYDLLPELAGYHLRRAQVAVFEDFARTVGKLRVTPGQFGVLTLVGANPGLTQSALARAIGIERSTMVAVIDGLERRALLERRPSPIDKRSYALVLSRRGQALIDRLRPLVLKHDRRIAERLDREERETLIRLLKRLHDGA
jgi:DNA-binding MarR family transcriptional regulator